MNVLALGAHHDDIELGCGGTLARLTRDGHSVFGLTLTNSETHYAIGDIHRTKEEAQSEALDAARTLGMKLVDLETKAENGTLVYDVKLMRSIESLLHDLKISLVFSHWNRDLNTDHEAAAKLTLVASRHIPRVLMYRSNGYQASQPFNATVFVDVTETISIKRQALECFRSEVRNRKQEWLDSFFDAHRSAGFGLGKGYVETFEPVRYELF